MIEFVVVVVLAMAVVAFVVFLSLRQEKNMQGQIGDLRSELKQAREMLLAGGYQEYERIKKKEPPPANEVIDEPNSPEISEANPISLDEITTVQIDDQPKRNIKIYK